MTIADRPSVPTDAQLAAELLALKQGEHLCLLYDSDPAEQLPALLPFLSQGLSQGEQCIYIADDHTLDDLRTALEHYGIDVEAETERQALQLWTRQQWRQPGELASERKAEQVRGFLAGAQAAGFKGVRFGVEMTWTLGPDISVDKLRHWEATINTIFTPQLPARIICQYSRKRLSPAAIEMALQTHPVAIVDNTVYPNPYYSAPLILDGAPADAARADWMISQLHWARAYENERAERIRAEAALAGAEASRERAEELLALSQATAENLRQAVAIKDEFLGLVSHELRTPVTTIYGNARLLTGRLAASMSQEQRDEAITDIAEEAARLQRIIENLLVLAKFDSAQGVEMQTLHVGDKLAEVVGNFSARHPRRRVVTSVDEGLPSAACNPVHLELVLTNLLSNADKYSPPEEPIEVIADFTGHSLRLRVLDRGDGITSEEAEKLFTPFYRADRTRRMAPGMGIGLAVCKRLVEAHGCSIWARPRESGGSEFGFTLPVQRS
jgi:signal transduction histidine kinase